VFNAKEYTKTGINRRAKTTKNIALENPAIVKPPKLTFKACKHTAFSPYKPHYYNQICLNKKKLTNNIKIMQEVPNFKTANLKQHTYSTMWDSKLTF
jgi:hypothetical protein